MNKNLSRAFFSLLLACCLAGVALPVYAAPARVNASAASVVTTRVVHRWTGRRAFVPRRFWRPRVYHGYPGSSEINQYYHGNVDFNVSSRRLGERNQDNSGNVGYNQGYSQDNSSNGGNQMILSGRPIHFRRINQYYVGNSRFNKRRLDIGSVNIGNSGNNGVNRGFSQDNDSNGGNQIIG